MPQSGARSGAAGARARVRDAHAAPLHLLQQDVPAHVLRAAEAAQDIARLGRARFRPIPTPPLPCSKGNRGCQEQRTRPEKIPAILVTKNRHE